MLDIKTLEPYIESSMLYMREPTLKSTKSLLRRFAAIASLFLGLSCAANPHPMAVPDGGGSIYLDDGGRTAPAVVFIHGNGGSAEQWRAQLEHLRAAGRRAVAIDLPGFGRSTAPANGDFSLDVMAAAVDRAVTAIHLRRFVLAGHSYGGAIVARYAALHPEKVAGAIYVDAAAARLPLTDEQKAQFAAALRANKMAVVRTWFAPMLGPSAEPVRQAVFSSVEKTPTDSLIAALLSLSSYDAKTWVDQYHGPRLTIAAADIESPAAFQVQFPDVKTVRISGAGHWVMLDKPDEVNAAIDAFLSGIGK